MTNLVLNRCDKVTVDTAGEERDRTSGGGGRGKERGRVNVVVVDVTLLDEGFA